MRIKKFKDFTHIKENYYGSYEEDDTSKEVEPYKTAKHKMFKVIKNWKSSAAVLTNVITKKLYFFYYEDKDPSDFYDYAWLPGYYEWDEDGKSLTRNTEAFEFDDEVVEEYVNDNTNYLEYGEGLEDYETGEYDFILIDETLREEIEKVFGKFD
jgi:hypothetical protein